MSGIVGANFTKDSGLKRSHKFQRFTADGIWVKPSGITTVCIEAIGAGGGGGGGGAAGEGGARGRIRTIRGVFDSRRRWSKGLGGWRGGGRGEIRDRGRPENWCAGTRPGKGGVLALACSRSATRPPRRPRVAAVGRVGPVTRAAPAMAGRRRRGMRAPIAGR